MNRSPLSSGAAGRFVGPALGLALLLTAQAPAQQQDATAPLGRFVPSDKLAVLIEHNGLDSQAVAWKGTAAYKMLNETSLGAMLEDITAQLADRGLSNLPGDLATGKDVVALLEHLIRKGFVIGYCGTINPPQPMAGVLVIRDAAKNPIFKRLIAQVPPLNEPNAQVIPAPGGRKVLAASGIPIRWWYEKDDVVFSFVPGADDPVLAVLENKAPSALKNPSRMALAKTGMGDVPIGLAFVDLAAMPPLPPDAAKLGLDGIKRVEASWSIRDKGVVMSLGVQAPRPRRGVMALFDQPPIGAGTKLVVPPGITEFAVFSIDPIKTGDVFMALLQQNDPESITAITKFSASFKARTGVNLRDDVLAKVGPRMAVVSPPGGSITNLIGMWFTPPEFSIVAEVKDAKGFAASLDRLIEVANRELKTARGMAPPRPGEPVRAGTEFAEFRRIKGPETGYILAVPPSVLITPAGMRPTIVYDASRKLVAIGTIPTSARRALTSLVLDGPATLPTMPRDALMFSQSDPSGVLPALLTNIPNLVQFAGLAASQPRPGMPNAGPPFRLQVDPDAIPEAATLRSYLFPSKYTVSVDDASIRMSAYMAFPVPTPHLNAGMEAPVLIALLLPAVQSAREAARRSQCVNNLKQMGLAMHNYESANGNFPAAAITDKQGKPLLSWRVAILPFIEQQSLYEKFKLDEPWDSPNNKELIKLMPSIYACPSRNTTAEPGMTSYAVFAGKGTLFDPTGPSRIANVTDGTSNTLMVVESTESVTWTKPDELPFEENQAPQAPLFGSGSSHPGGFNALFADGSVKFIKNTINLQVLRALITRAGGEVVSADSF